MYLSFSEEQEELRRGLRRFCEDKSPMSEVRRLMETTEGYDPAVWSRMAGELGLQGLAIPEEYGGSGFGVLELVVVQEELGRALVCAPYLATMVAAEALLAAGDEAAAKDLLPAIAAGETVATLAQAEDDGQWRTDGFATTAAQQGDGWVLSGRKSFVLDGHTADLLLVAAQAPQGPTLFAVEAGAPGLTVTPVQTVDMTRKQARVELADTPARLVGTAGGAGELLARTRDLAIVLLAAEQVGGASRCLEQSVEYAKLRVQFGRPIGSFMAVKHKCADMLLVVESARSAAYAAAWAAADGSAELASLAAMAKAYCSEAYFTAAADTIQIHGGIGFTWEHDAHLYYRRAKSTELLYGDPTYHRERLAALLIDA